MPLSKLALLYPQIALAVGILLVLLFGIRKAGSQIARDRTLTIAIVFLAISVWLVVARSGSADIWGIMQFDLFSGFFLVLAVLAAAITLVFSADSIEIARNRFAEYAALIMTICMGVSMMAASKDLLTAYLSLEMVSLSSYILTGFRRNQAGSRPKRR